MHISAILLNYIIWHYTRAFADIARIWGNAFWFVSDFFSFGVVVTTFFKPWKRLKDTSSRTVLVAAFLERFIVNTLMRIVGMLMRSFIIVVGLISFIIVLVAGIVLVLAWIALPVIIGYLFILSFRLIF